MKKSQIVFIITKKKQLSDKFSMDPPATPNGVHSRDKAEVEMQTGSAR